MNFYFALILVSPFWCLQSKKPKNLSGSRYAARKSPYTITTTAITNVSFDIEIKKKPIGDNNCLINVKESLSGNKVFEYDSSKCDGRKITNLDPGTQYEITLTLNASIYSRTSTASVTTKHSVSFIMQDISTISVIITITFTPMIDFETERCSIVLLKDSNVVNEQPSTSCIETNFNELIPSTKYDVNLIYVNYSYSTSFTTLPDHTIIITVTELTCTKVVIKNVYQPNIDNLVESYCKSTLQSSDNVAVSCTPSTCQQSCSNAIYEDLKQGTKYQYIVGAHPRYSSKANTEEFETLKDPPYTIIIDDVKNTSFMIKILKMIHSPYACNITVSLLGTTVPVINEKIDLCDGFFVKDLQPNTSYKIELILDSKYYCGTTVNYTLTKYNVSFTVKAKSTINVRFKITFTPMINFETERCSIMLLKDSKIVKAQSSTSCIEANFNDLIPSTKYDVNLTYINYTYSTSFTTLPDHTITFTVTKLTCTSVKIEKVFQPTVQTFDKVECTNILYEGDRKTIPCIGVNCESSCLSNSYTNLAPSTNYTFVSASYPYLTSKNFTVSFMTKSYTPYILSFSNIEVNGFTVSIENKPKILKNCKLNVHEETTGNIQIIIQRDDCNNFIATNLLPGTKYIIYLEISNSNYCDQANASIRTKYDVSITFITTTITANVMVTFKPELSEKNKKCWLKVYFPMPKNDIKIQFNCYNTIVDKLKPNTMYDIEITHENYTYNNSFKTNLNHSISSTLVSITCYSASINNTFLPQVSDIEKKLCVSELQSSRTEFPCFGKDCETSCVHSAYDNLIPGTKYIYTVSSYPILTSKSFQFNFITQFINPFQLLERNAQYSKVNIEVYSDNQAAIPPCKFTIYSSVTSYKRDVSMESCQTYIFTGLQPMQSYSISMVPSPNKYCTTVVIDVKTTELMRTIHVLQTNLSSIKLSSLPPYEDTDVTDTCHFNVSSKYDNYNKFYSLSSCPDLTISGLRSGNQYIIVTRNKYSTSLLTFNAKTKIQDPICNFKLSIQKFNLLIQWNNNNSAIYPIIYVLKLYILNRKSDFRRTEIIFRTNNCNSSCNSSIFKDLSENINYRIEICARPKDDWCNDLDKNDQNCYFCNSEEFYYPQKTQYDSNRVFFNKVQSVINISYIPPQEDQFGNILYCFISMSQVHRPYDRQIEFDDILDQPMIGGNQWFTIKVLNETDCTNGNFTLIPLKYKKNIMLHSIEPGFFYYSAVTFCSNLLCSTTKIYEMIYISASTDEIITVAFLTCLSLAIIFYLIAISLVIYGYEKKPTENTESKGDGITLKRLEKNENEVISEAPSQIKIVDNSKFEDKKIDNKKQKVDVCTANKVPLDPSGATYHEHKKRNQIVTRENTKIVNDKKESEQKKPVMIAETRSRKNLNPEMKLKINKLESEGSSLKFAENVAEIKIIPNMEIELIKVVDIDRSFDQMINSKDEKLVKQYSIVNKIQPNSMAVGVTPDNTKLNRYSNIIPGDEHLIVLSKNYSKNAYINASKIHGIYSELDYIATQGPTPDTVADFYSMILENNVKTVVMLTNLLEGGRLKCDQYLPLKNVTCNFEKFKITQNVVDLNDTNVADSKIEAAFKSEGHQIKDIATDVSDVIVEFQNIKHIFRHFHYKIWPDKSVPNNLESLILLRKIMRDWHGESRTPIVVHCSAGVGRTGSFICFDYNLCRLENFMDTFSVYGYVSSIRKSRPMMVQTYEQYKLIHKLLSRVAQ